MANYLRGNGYHGLKAALDLTPDEVIGIVKDSGLQGRGGAGFPRRDEVVVHPATRAW